MFINLRISWSIKQIQDRKGLMLLSVTKNVSIHNPSSAILKYKSPQLIWWQNLTWIVRLFAMFIISLKMNIHSFHCRNITFSNYKILPNTDEGYYLPYSTWYTTIFPKHETFWINKHIRSCDFLVRTCGIVFASTFSLQWKITFAWSIL